ncbi:putative polygalacturonase [Acorus calamus]|uniref:Polygalacturonase n=1 Tax=Acorus calamus TaxID=4465 RepID=A0AAV9DX55_ACOCL|nr:putative polygalacturonase [Acorus calamus]
MGLFTTIVVTLSLALTASANPPTFFSVVDFGAAGDGETDDSQASSPTMIVPPRKTFLVKPVNFAGPCKSINLSFQILGNVVAPNTSTAWKRFDARLWLTFRGVIGLTVNGSERLQMDSQAMTFYRCADLRLSDVKFINSPKTHVLIQACKRISIANLHISSPKDSPNTDGIHIESSQHVDVRATVIGSGKGGANVAVEDIRVSYASFNGTTNGARIKTWQGATGYARKISFEHLNFTSVENPIIINQYYCDSTSCKNQTMGVKISNVSYIEAFGTSITPVAVSLLCSETDSPPLRTVSTPMEGLKESSNLGILAFVLLCLSSSSIGSSQIFDLAANGAVGDGKTDDTKAKALAGNIVAPNFLWRPAAQLSNWIAINQVEGLIIDGRGSIDGRGYVWWDCKASNIRSVYGSNNFHIGGGLTLTNSPGKHMTFSNCNYVTIDGINIVSPGDSPNTDGVYTQETQHVKIQNSFIGTGARLTNHTIH